MYYSITFTDSSGATKNTWADWHMIPSAPPIVEPPEPYTNYVEIPGRKAGPIDLSEILTGEPSYQRSEGEWEFVIFEPLYPRSVLYQMLKDFLHGKNMTIELEEDPQHYYHGRLSISAPNMGPSFNAFTIKYSIEPVRYLYDGTQEGF